MDSATIMALFNLVAPHAFKIIGDQINSSPTRSYKENLEAAGVRLDAEHAQLLADMAQAVKDGAVPRTPPGS